ncbi:hypothetical protein [Holzapfeliella sp. JNUCC 72]
MTKEKCMTVVVDKDVPDVRYSVEIKDKEESEIDAIVLMMNPASSYYGVTGMPQYKHSLRYLESNLNEKSIACSENHPDCPFTFKHKESFKKEKIDPTTKKIANKFKNVILVNVSPFVQRKTNDSYKHRCEFLDKIMEKKIKDTGTNNQDIECSKKIKQKNEKYIIEIIKRNPKAQIIVATGELPYKMSQYYFDIISSIDNTKLYGFIDKPKEKDDLLEPEECLRLTQTGYTKHPSIGKISKDKIVSLSDVNYNKSMHRLFGKAKINKLLKSKLSNIDLSNNSGVEFSIIENLRTNNKGENIKIFDLTKSNFNQLVNFYNNNFNDNATKN